MADNIFEKIRKINEYKQEFWSAREIMPLLGYVRWENFDVAISRAKESCKNSGQDIDDHFRDATKMIKIAVGTPQEAAREIQDYDLSRYACYWIAQNGDPRKDAIAFAMTYFAVQTRKQEILEKRLAILGTGTSAGKADGFGKTAFGIDFRAWR
jgi:DNA-damage-inducible protein D